MVAHKKPLVDLATQMIDFIFLQSQDEALHGPLLHLQSQGVAFWRSERANPRVSEITISQLVR